MRPPPAHDGHPVRRIGFGLRRAAGELKGLAGAVVGRMQRHGTTGRAGQFAYNAFMATIPFLFILVSVAGLAGSPDTYDRLVDDLGDAVPAEVSAFLKSALGEATRNTQQATVFLIVGVISGLYLTGNVMGTLTQGLDDAYGVPGRPWLKGKLASIAFAGVASLLALVATVAMVGGPLLVEAISSEVGVGSGGRSAASNLAQLAGLVVFAAFLLMCYRYLPNLGRLRFRHVAWGTVIAGTGWLAATRLFRLYVDNFGSYNKVYGSLGAVVVYLVFLYITGLVLLIGGEANAELRERGMHPAPREAEARPAASTT